MALKLNNYELPDGTILDEAYFRVNNITTNNTDYELLVPSEKEGFELETKWISKIESTANIFVWADEIARKHRVAAIHWFPITFQYDLSDWQNIYEQAYNKLKEELKDSEDC